MACFGVTLLQMGLGIISSGKSMLSQIIDLRSLRVPQSTSANKSSSLGTGTLSSS